MSFEPRSNQPETVEQLFEAHYGALLRFVRRRTADRELARDVVASSFLTAWRRRDDLPKTDDLRLAWLYAVARNELGTHIRSQKRTTALVARMRSSAQTAPPYAELSAGDEEASGLGEVFNALPAADREVLSLHAWEGLDNVTAAKSLGCTTNAFAIRLHRARARLSAELERKEPAQGARSDSARSTRQDLTKMHTRTKEVDDAPR